MIDCGIYCRLTQSRIPFGEEQGGNMAVFYVRLFIGAFYLNIDYTNEKIERGNPHGL